MVVFSKINKIKICEIKMILLEATTLPYDLYIPIFGTAVICVVSYYIFKWLNSDVDVPVRDSTKNHNWKAIRLDAKVRV